MKNLPSLIHAAYCHASLKQNSLIESLTSAPTLPPDQLQEIGFNGVLANEIRPLVNVLSHLQTFILTMPDFIDLPDDLVEYITELQETLQENQQVITLPLPPRINEQLRQANQHIYPPVSNELNIFLFALGPNDPYQMSGQEANECFNTAPLADMDDLSFLFGHLHTFLLIDVSQPDKELTRLVKSFVNQLTKYI